MQDGVYNAVFGAMTQEYRLNQISNDMANLNTVGYKQDKMAFEDVLTHYAHDFLDPNFGLSGGVIWPQGNQLTQPRIGVSEIGFEQGALNQTGNQLDLALDGEGFFQIQTPEGDFYTRNGQFKVNDHGQLVNSQGHPLMGEGGEIQLP
ncbi:MAG: flagellar hook-basal body protein, partial [Desulfohalobiaceae bacterium]